MKRKKRIVKGLKEIYQAPEPVRKYEFLQRLEEPGLSFGEFLWQQCGYIRKWNFGFSVLAFVLAVWGTRTVQKELLWALAAGIPFLALATVAEGSRSIRFGMEELELSTRFSMKTTVLARFSILGLANLVSLGILIPILCVGGQVSLLYSGIYILVPYLLAAFLNLYAVRKIHRRESIYVCMGITVLISGCYVILGNTSYPVQELFGAPVWVCILGLLTVLTGREFRNMLHQSEEMVWNL